MRHRSNWIEPLQTLSLRLCLYIEQVYLVLLVCVCVCVYAHQKWSRHSRVSDRTQTVNISSILTNKFIKSRVAVLIEKSRPSLNLISNRHWKRGKGRLSSDHQIRLWLSLGWATRNLSSSQHNPVVHSKSIPRPSLELFLLYIVRLSVYTASCQ